MIGSGWLPVSLTGFCVGSFAVIAAVDVVDVVVAVVVVVVFTWQVFVAALHPLFWCFVCTLIFACERSRGYIHEGMHG